MIERIHIYFRIAIASAVAILIYSCKGKLSEIDPIDAEATPIQIVNNAFFVQTENGVMQLRMEANIMKRYENDSISYETFPKGIAVYAYTDEGLIETEIVSDDAKHTKCKDGQERWEAFGNVVVRNLIKKEVMETDTLYWDKENEKIYTHCFVKLYSPQGFMQGYGMESDERARNATIYRPFNSYGIITEDDSTKVVIDSVNFIGPFRKK